MAVLDKCETKVFGFALEQQEPIPSVTNLAKTMHLGKGNASRYVNRLEEKGLIRISKRGKKHQISVQEHHRFLFMKVIENFPTIKIEDILAGKMPLLLAHLNLYTKRERKEYTDFSSEFMISDIDLPAISTKRMLSKLKRMGIVYKASRREYRVRVEEAYPVLDFCAAICTDMYLHAANQELEGIIEFRISFESVKNPEVIVVTNKNNSPESYWPTAYSAIGEYGINLIPSGKYYYSNMKPDLCRLIIHLLAIGRDPRSLMYVAALMYRNDFEYKRLLEQKTLFETYRNLIKKIIRFVENQGVGGGVMFPNWDEVLGV